jgi:ABC-type multidrug transport system ATPase subunit
MALGGLGRCGERGVLRALDISALSFSAQPDEMTAFLGPNGAGAA